MIDQILNWLDRWRVPIGILFSVVIVAIGGLLIWYDRNSPVTKVEAVSVEGVSATAKSTSTAVGKIKTGQLININTASVKELDALPGIGPTYAERIVKYRESNGVFKTTRDIVKVKGIGEGTFAKIKGLISTGGE